MGTRTQRRARATEQSIVEAARDLLAAGGGAAVTLEAVASRADVAVQTVYNRVGGRNAVLMAVARHALDTNRQYLDAPYASSGTVAERLRRVAEAYAHFALERPAEFQLLAFPPAGVPDADAERIVALVREQNGKLARLVAEGVADGTLDPELDPEVTATALWRMWDGVLSLASRPDDLQLPPERMPALLLTAGRLMQTGLLRRPPEGPAAL